MMLKFFYMSIFLLASNSLFSESTWVPKISIITSLYKGGDFIKGFMADIVRQTIFDQCELIIINAHSPDSTFETEIIENYTRHYPNIIYFSLADDEPDPGLYGVWNMAIERAQGEYIINANVDDRLAPYALYVLSKALDENATIDLVYSACYISKQKNEFFEQLHMRPLKIILDWPEYYCPADMFLCLPGNHPMWRKSMHEKCGLFDANYKAAGDWEFFLRAVEHGCKFMKVRSVLGTFYQDDHCLTHNPIHGKEMVSIRARYSYLWS